MAPQMKGLTQFIVDLRSTKDSHEENKRINLEINNIQQKFNSNLNSYQKKKYVCKLMYIYLLGYTDMVDFGIKEARELISGSTYQEKQLGYLAINLLNEYKPPDLIMDHLDQVLDLVYSTLIRDLQSEHEDINCVALNFICSHFNVNDDNTNNIQPHGNWQELIDMVYSCCTSPLTSNLIKKKASITLYILLKLYPQVVIINTTWIPRLLSLLDNENLGVVVSSLPLIELLIKLQPKFIKSILSSISNKLYTLIIERNCPPTYFYYDCPAPWLVIKLLRLIETFYMTPSHQTHEPILSIADLNDSVLAQLRKIVSKSILIASEPLQGLPNRNCQLAILFQAVSLAVFLNASPDAIDGAIHALLSLLDSYDTNTKYLALDALIKLTSRSNQLESKFDDQLPQIYQLLNDKDVSVRKKSLDLIVTVCNPKSYNNIIDKLLDYFPLSDFQIKPDLAIKIAILTENFAVDSTWYVTTMLKLLSIGGGYNSNGISYISNEVWERIVQIIINNVELQLKSCKLIINLLKTASSNNKANPGVVPESLVKVAAIILGEFGDQADQLPDHKIGTQFQLLYEAYFKVSLITRAMLLSTFLKFLVKFPDNDFQFDIVDLFEAESQSIDLEIQTRAYEYLQLATMKSNPLANEIIKPLPYYSRKESVLMTRIGMNNTHIKRNRSLVLSNVIKQDTENPFEETNKINLSSNWYPGYLRMLHYDAGIFYENQLIKITYRFVKDGYKLNLKLTVINNSFKSLGTNITGFKVLSMETGTDRENPTYVIDICESPEPSFSNKTTLEFEIKIRNIVEIEENPIVTFTFTCGGSFNQLNLKFPIVLLKSISSTSTPTVDEFRKRWLQIGEQLGVEKGEHANQVTASHRANSSNIVRLLNRCGFVVVHSTQDDDEALLVLGTGILHTQNSNYGILVSMKSVDGKSFDVNVRCTGGGVAEIVSLELKEVLEGSF